MPDQGDEVMDAAIKIAVYHNIARKNNMKIIDFLRKELQRQLLDYCPYEY